MFQEKVTRKCKYCNMEAEKLQHGRFPSGPKRWRDISGKMWVGSVCPNCHKERMKLFQRTRRANGRTGTEA